MERVLEREEAGSVSLTGAGTTVDGAPILVRRCVDEIERRGLDIIGIYQLGGTDSKKTMLRLAFEEGQAELVDLSSVNMPDINVITALLKAMAKGDDDVVCNLFETRNQIFVRTGEGQYLDRLGSGLGVSRPSALGLLDEDFQELIPNQSLKAKQIRQIFYDNMDVFWGPLFSRVNVTTNNVSTYDLSPGDEFIVSIDGGDQQSIKVLAGDVATAGAATAEELANVLSRIKGATVSIIESVASGTEAVNVRTDSVGPRGSIQFFTSSAVSAVKVDFPVGKRLRITDLDQRTTVYEINSRELLIELPATVPALKRSLKGSHHIHADATLESPDPTSGKTWQGSFLYGPETTPYTVTAQNARLQQNIIEGQVYTAITVDQMNITQTSGFLVFEWGKEANTEQPVGFIGIPNSNTILLDPAYKFQKTHLSGTKVRVIQSDLQPQSPRKTGDDLAIYLTSPAEAREIVEDFLRRLAAAGIIVNFVILLPEYRYLCKNPYED